MGDYNPNTPQARGQEERYVLGFEAPFVSSLYQAQLRIRPGAGVGADAVHLCLPTVKGAPGIHVAVVDEQQPAATFTDYYPGTTTGATILNFEDQGGGALTFDEVNDPNDDNDYAQFSVARTANQSGSLQFRGNNAGALAGKRILRVQIGALIMNRRIIGTGLSNNAIQLPVQGEVVINGTTYQGNVRHVPKIDAFQLIPDLADWYLNPATGLPWAVGEVDDLIDSADADTFGLKAFGTADDAGERISAFWLRVHYCDENRLSYFDRRGSLRRGWDRYPNTGTLTTPGGGAIPNFSADTWYWIEVGALTGSLQDFFTVGAVVPSRFPATDVTDDTLDQRQSSVVLTTGPGGAGQEGAEKIATSQVHGAYLLDDGGVILGESQAYVTVDPNEFVGRYLGVDLIVGQQVTTDASVPAGGYAGIKCPVGWYDPTLMPNAPLVFEVRHGAGAINGGGTLDATATLVPQATPNGELQDYFIRFDDGNVVLSTGTQYHVVIRSDAVALWGANAWRVPVDDSRSDLIASGSGTSSAQVQGATQGGTTDSFFRITSGTGTADDRYDIPLTLEGPPEPPATVTATTYDAEPEPTLGCPSTLPPRVRLQWSATNLGADFGGYRVWTRRRALPVEQWVLAAELNTTTLLTDPADAEELFTEHWLSELGWGVAGAGYAEGWDIGVSVIDNSAHLESAIRSTGVANTPEPTSASWLTSDAARWLSCPLFVEVAAPSEPLTTFTVYDQVAGRDHAVVRVPGTVPGRKYKLRWESDQEFPDESILRGPRAAAMSGRQLALLRCRGDRALGAISEPTTEPLEISLAATADFVTTGSDPSLAGPNMPPGYVLDGSADRITHADDSLLDPDLAPFSVLYAAVFAGTNGVVHFAKHDGSTGYIIDNSALNTLRVRIAGADGTVTLTDASFPFDDLPHVIVVTSPGDGTGAKYLYVDGELVTSSTTDHGSVTNASDLSVGASSAGASFAADTIHAYGVWLLELTDAQQLNSTRYLLGHAGYRMTPAASLFVDARDAEAQGEDDTVVDQAGNALDGTIVGAPRFVGVPWNLRELERKR